MAEGDAADHQGQRLGAGDAAHVGDNRHQHRQVDELVNHILEGVDHQRGEGRGNEVDPEPDGAAAGGFEHRGEGVVLLVEARHAHQRVLGAVADDIDHIVDGDAADELVVRIDHRRRNPVALLEKLRHPLRRQRNRNRLDVGAHDIEHERGGVRHEQLAQRQDALKIILAVDHVNAVGHFGNDIVAAQIAQHEFHRVPLAHGDGVGVHQAAGGVLVVGQHGLEPLAVLLVHRLQYFIGDLLRELLEDVGEVVGFKPGGEFGDFGGVVFAQELALQVFIEVLDDLAPGVLIEQLPKHAAGLGWRGFKQVRDGGGGQGFDHLPHLVERAAFQRELQQAQAVAVMLGVGHEAGPEGLRRWILAVTTLGIFAEAFLNEGYNRREGLVFVRAFGFNAQHRPFDRGEHHQREDAFAIDHFFVANADFAGEARSHADEFRRRPGMQPGLVDDAGFGTAHGQFRNSRWRTWTLPIRPSKWRPSFSQKNTERCWPPVQPTATVI